MRRRDLIKMGVAALATAAVPIRAADPARVALTESNLVYLSPVKADGTLSSCQAEVWYVMLGPDVYVCTSSGSWRARAPGNGASQTKIWVGDLGVWRSANYQSLPSVMANASVESDASRIEAALQVFGNKYASEWGRWGPRFRSGLKDGSRTMLRYELA